MLIEGLLYCFIPLKRMAQLYLQLERFFSWYWRAPYWVYCAGKMTAFFVHLSCTFSTYIFCVIKFPLDTLRFRRSTRKLFFFFKAGCRKFRATCESMQKYADLDSAAFLYSTDWVFSSKSECTVAWNINTPTPI